MQRIQRVLCVLLALLGGIRTQAQGPAPVPAPAQNICAIGAPPTPTRPGPSPVQPGPGGIGGTGVIAGRPGIGGTGIDPGGIGGTGIVGVITGFASICVNGVEVHFDDTTPVNDGGEPVSARQLALGQLVAVQANGQGVEVSARRITLIHTVVGPITALDAVAGQVLVLGQTVRVRDRHALDDLQPGDWVRISGLRQAQRVIDATRLEVIARQPQVQLTGVVEQVQGDSVTVGAARVRIGEELRAGSLAPGAEISVAGLWDGATLRAQRFQRDPTRLAIAGTDRVVLEGYVHAAGAGQLDLGHGPLTLAPQVQLPGSSLASLAQDQRVLVLGRIGPDRQITVDRVELHRSGGEGARDTEIRGRRDARSASGRDAARSDRTQDRHRERERDGRREREEDRGRDRQESGTSGRAERSGSDDSGRSSGGSGSSGSSGGSDDSGKSSGGSGESGGSHGGSRDR